MAEILFSVCWIVRSQVHPPAVDNDMLTLADRPVPGKGQQPLDQKPILLAHAARAGVVPISVDFEPHFTLGFNVDLCARDDRERFERADLNLASADYGSAGIGALLRSAQFPAGAANDSNLVNAVSLLLAFSHIGVFLPYPFCSKS